MRPPSRADPPVAQSGNAIHLGAVPGWGTWGAVAIDFDVIVPADAQVRTRSGSGAQMVEGVGGPVDAGAGSGNIRVGHAGSSVRLSTGSGHIELDGGEGPVIARAASGSISAMAVKGDIEAHTGSGRVSVSQMANGRTDITSASGNIMVSDAHGALRLRTASGTVAVNGEPTGPWSVNAASGSVTITVEGNAAFDLDAHSSSGRIESKFPVTTTGRLSRRQLSGQVRGGGPRIEVSTASGSIGIR